MKRIGYCSLALLAAVALAARPAGAQVVNGGFETGTFTGWANTGNTTFDGVAVGAVHSGTFGAFFGPIGSTSFLSQGVATTTGASYALSFWLRNDGAGTNSFDVSWGGSSLFSLSNSPVFAYTQYNFNVVGGAGASTALQFTFRNDPSFFDLDDVSLTPTEVVPEPATMSLLATGLAGMAGAGMRRRRKQA